MLQPLPIKAFYRGQLDDGATKKISKEELIIHIRDLSAVGAIRIAREDFHAQLSNVLGRLCRPTIM